MAAAPRCPLLSYATSAVGASVLVPVIVGQGCLLLLLTRLPVHPPAAPLVPAIIPGVCHQQDVITAGLWARSDAGVQVQVDPDVEGVSAHERG